jgi:hypothetical protein
MIKKMTNLYKMWFNLYYKNLSTWLFSVKTLKVPSAVFLNLGFMDIV